MLLIPIAVVLSILVFLIGSAWSVHWRILAALIPIASTFFFGIIGLFISVFFVAALYKAGA